MEPRAPLEHELSELIGFLDRQLRRDQAWSIAEEYPLALKRGNLQNIRLVKVDEKIVASAVVKQMLIKTPIGLLNVAAIGSVVTAPEFRNQGHSHRLLIDCLNLGLQQGCDLAVLWSDLYEFYSKIGFELAGSEVALMLGDKLKLPPSGLRFMESKQIAAEALGRLYLQHTTGTVRTVSDIQRHLQIPNMRVFTAWDKNNQLQAYAIEGKGLDLQGYIHEWGGGVSHLLPLLNHILETKKQPITVIAPAHSQNLIRHLTEQGVQAHHGYLGMIKVLNFENLILKVKRHAFNLGLEDFIFERKDEHYYIGSSKNFCKLKTDADLVKVLFGPSRPAELGFSDPDPRHPLNLLFPIPLWIWGWDSV